MPSQASEITHPSSDLDPEVLIKVDNVSKKFCRDFKKSLWYGLKDTATDIVHPTHRPQDSQLRPGEFWANQNVSFEVKRGECLGLIGHNGAGKTTLLKMLNGLMKPDTGSITMRGRVGALIALGAGFNPILTGRENIYVNGSILGLSKKEIASKLDEIVDFAEVADAIDAPVRTYSSGMQVRLGFAVAAVLIQPDILIIDEVLAVGDASFQCKCINVVKACLARGTATILVSHQMHTLLRFCETALYLDHGSVRSRGLIGEMVTEYTLDQEIPASNMIASSDIDASHYSGYVPIVDGIILSKATFDQKGHLIGKNEVLDAACSFCIAITLNIKKAISNIIVEMALNDAEGLLLRELSSPMTLSSCDSNEHTIQMEIPALGLATGPGEVGIAIWDETHTELLAWSRNNTFKIQNKKSTAGRLCASVDFTASPNHS